MVAGGRGACAGAAERRVGEPLAAATRARAAAAAGRRQGPSLRHACLTAVCL